MAKRIKIRPTLNGRPMFPSEYLCAEDLLGRDVTLTISRVKIGDMPTDSGPQRMPFLYFEEMDRKRSKKRLGTNVTNARSIGRMYGPEATGWVGKRITLFPTTCDAFGEPDTPCIRIREVVPAGKSAPEPNPEPPDDDEASGGELSEEQEAEAFGGEG